MSLKKPANLVDFICAKAEHARKCGRNQHSVNYEAVGIFEAIANCEATATSDLNLQRVFGC